METIVIVLYLLTSFAIIGLILMQQGKGAEMGASFGTGASGTVFGSQGGGNFFSRVTAILATVFFVLAFGLTFIAKQKSGVEDIPALVEERAVQDSDIPVLEEAPASAGEIPTLETESSSDAGDIPTTSDIPAGESESSESQ